MDYYNAISQGYDELHGAEQRRKIEAIKSRIPISSSSKILDIGCGTGLLSNFECFVVGADPSIGMLKQNKGVKVNSMAENLPFKDNTFDFVVSITSMHHFDIKRSISEMKRIGKKTFVFSLLKKSGKFEIMKSAIGRSFKITEIVDEGKDEILFCE